MALLETVSFGSVVGAIGVIFSLAISFSVVKEKYFTSGKRLTHVERELEAIKLKVEGLEQNAIYEADERRLLLKGLVAVLSDDINQKEKVKDELNNFLLNR